MISKRNMPWADKSSPLQTLAWRRLTRQLHEHWALTKSPAYKPWHSVVVRTQDTCSNSPQGIIPNANRQSEHPLKEAKKIQPYSTLPLDILLNALHNTLHFFPRIRWRFLSQRLQALIHHFARHCSAPICTSKRILLISLSAKYTLPCTIFSHHPRFNVSRLSFIPVLSANRSIQVCNFLLGTHDWLTSRITYLGHCMNLLTFEHFGHMLIFTAVL